MDLDCTHLESVGAAGSIGESGLDSEAAQPTGFESGEPQTDILRHHQRAVVLSRARYKCLPPPYGRTGGGAACCPAKLAALPGRWYCWPG